MLVPFLIMLREGIEAALIVGIIASYLAQTGRREWMPAIWTGVGLAVMICAAVGVILDLISAEFSQRIQEMFEAAVGTMAVLILTSMVFWMKKAARSIKRELHESVDAAVRAGSMALVGMAFFAVAREGLETVFFLLAAFQQMGSVGWGALAGAVLGLAGAVAVGVAIYAGGLKINLRHFFRITGVFILIVAAGLLSGVVRSLHEAGLWNGLQERAFDLSAVLPADSLVGAVLGGLFGYDDMPTIGEVLAYLVFLIPALILFLSNTRHETASRPASSAVA